jgi:hypothetical protein
VQERIRRRWTISRILFLTQHPKAPDLATTIPLAPPSLAGSSDLPGGFGRAVLITPPYLVLLRAGFSLPSALQRTRCALTAPFHPYPPLPSRASAGGIFSVPLSFRSPRPGITRRTALWSSDFPPRVLPPVATSRAAVVCPSTTDCQRAPMYQREPTTAQVRRRSSDGRLSVICLSNPILLKSLVQITARCVNQLDGSRDIPPLLAQLLHGKRPLGDIFELVERARAHLRRHPRQESSRSSARYYTVSERLLVEHVHPQ